MHLQTFLERWQYCLSWSDLRCDNKLSSIWLLFSCSISFKSFPATLSFISWVVPCPHLSGQPHQALPSLFSQWGYSVLFSTHFHGCPLPFHPPLTNHSASLFAVLISHVRTPSMFSVSKNALSFPDVPSPVTLVLRETRTLCVIKRHPVLAASSDSGLSCCLLTLRLICNHPWPLSTSRFLAALCNWLSGLLIIFLQMY